ncbi:hypothetical protein FKR81_04720 [Lentzea tibetensis]|uniref:Uncharacterized protein n=1 Tax=Lentzea tibetensis TaxID=2591470 RepID=A0A563EZW9_9PSEU|nr:hypothetical protein [Lentzea tibetensis]TWP53277.1 hypothetical protein FKR81_04720 [Lentzea tibetensis]
MTDDPKVLLEELSGLRKRVRHDRHGYWFPLLLFGVLTFAAMPLYAPKELPVGGVHVDYGVGWRLFGTYVDPFRLYYPVIEPLEHPLALGLYWTAVLVLGFLATVRWYRWRAQRTGVETPTRTYAVATSLALAVPLVGVPVLWFVSATVNIMGWWLNGARTAVAALLLVAVVVAIVAMRRNPSRRVALAVCVPAVLVSTTLLVALSMVGHGQFLVLAVGLLALAWVERSTLFAVIALVFTISALLTTLYTMENVFWRLGLPQFVGDDVLLPAAVLLLGGVAGLAAQAVSREQH